MSKYLIQYLQWMLSEIRFDIEDGTPIKISNEKKKKYTKLLLHNKTYGKFGVIYIITSRLIHNYN